MPIHVQNPFEGEAQKSSPLEGEGREGGWDQKTPTGATFSQTASRSGLAPTPNPSPQGGGEMGRAPEAAHG